MKCYIFFSKALFASRHGIFAETLKAKYLDIKEIDAFIDCVVKA